MGSSCETQERALEFVCPSLTKNARNKNIMKIIAFVWNT